MNLFKKLLASLLLLGGLALGLAPTAQAQAQPTWTWLQDEPMLVNAAGGPCQPPVASCNIPVGQFAPTTAGSVWVIAIQTSNNVTISSVTGGGGTWVHCPNCHGINASGFNVDAWYNLTGLAGTSQNISITLSASSGAVFGETFYEILPPAGSTASFDTSNVGTGSNCTSCATPALTLTATDAVIINPGGAASHGFDSYASPYITDWNGAGIGLNIAPGTATPSKTFLNASNPSFFAIAFKSSLGTFSVPARQYSLLNQTKSSANCTNCTVPVSTGTGHLLFVQAASQNGAFIQSVSGGGSGWVVPSGANSCRIAGAIAGVSAASSSCAYLLSSTAGASSLAVTMSGGGQVNLGVWEISSSTGTFSFDAQGSFYIATTSAFYDNGPALSLSANDVVFQSSWIQGGSLGPTNYPLTNIPSNVIPSVGGGNYLMLNQFSISALLDVPAGPAPVAVWVNPQHDNIFVMAMAFSAGPKTIFAADCNTTTVQTAVNGAAKGDTVVLPACPAGVSWTTKLTDSGVNIRGQGAGRPFAYSQTVQTLTTGSKTFIINPTDVNKTSSQLSLTAGTALVIQELGFKTNVMQGTITSYTPSSGSLLVNVTSASGTCGAAGPANTMDSSCARWMVGLVPQTVIINNDALQGGTGNEALFTLTEDSTSNTDVSGFKIQAGTGQANGFNVLAGGGKPIILHDIFWEQNGFDGVYTNSNRGLIYNMAFAASPWSNTGVGFHQKFAPSSSWTTASNFGSNDVNGLSNFYVETSACYAYLNCSDVDDYGRNVWRFNFMWDSGFGTHGADTSTFGIRYFEYYNNVGVFESGSNATVANMNQWMFVRGGTFVVHHNTLPTISSVQWGSKLSINMTEQPLRRRTAFLTCWGANFSSAGQFYHAPRQVGMGFVTGTGTANYPPAGVNNSSTDTNGAYVGDSEPAYIWANSQVPLNGVGTTDYFASDGSQCSGGTFDSSGVYIQANRDYFNGTTVKPGYTAFTYPHPLISGTPITGPASDVYLAQVAAGTADGSSCSNARAASYFNLGANWGTGLTQIGGGTVVHFCGSISIVWTPPTSQGTGRITLRYEPGAKLSAPANQNFIVFGPSTNKWKIDGGTLCGPQPSGGNVDVPCNGVIENTANGTNLANQVYPVVAIDHSRVTGDVEVVGVDIRNLYVHTAPIVLTNITSNGSTTVTATCATPCGFSNGQTLITVQDSTVAAQNITTTTTGGFTQVGGATVASVSGTSITLTYPSAVAAGTSSVGSLTENAIHNSSVNCTFANSGQFLGNFTIHDGICREASWALDEGCSAGASVTFEAYHMDLFHTDHGLAIGGSNTDQSCIFKFHDNRWRDPSNWNTGTINSYHHDGAHAFNSPTSAAAIKFWNNKWEGPFTDNGTAVIFLQSCPVNFTQYNDVLMVDATTTADPTALWFTGGGPNQTLYNNSLIQNGQPKGVGPHFTNSGTIFVQVQGGCGASSANTFLNNISTSGTSLMSSSGAVYSPNGGALGLDYNLYANYITNGNAAFNWNGTNTNIFSAWQSSSGEGLHSRLVSTANLDVNGIPLANSPAVATGLNICGLISCTGDLAALAFDSSAGNTRTPLARPTVGAWDIGAFNKVQVGTLAPPTGLTATPVSHPYFGNWIWYQNKWLKEPN